MKYIFILFAFLFVCSSTLHAQLVPGYMGKRHFFEVGGIVGLNHSERRQAVVTNNRRTAFSPITIRPELTYNYVLSRKIVAHLGYTYSAFKISSRADSYPIVTGGAEYQVYSNDFSLGFDIYPIKKRPYSLAPFGRYLRLGLHVVNTSGTPTDIFVKEHGYKKESISFNAVGIEVGWGYRTIIGERLVLSFNVQTILFPTSLPGNLRFLIYPDAYKNQLSIALTERYMLGAKLAIGVLL